MAGLVLLTLGYVLSQFYRSVLAVLSPALIRDLGVTNLDLANSSAALFLGFALAQFVVGVGLDRFGPSRTTSFMLGLIGASGAFVFAAAQSPFMLILAMALIGIGCSPVLMAALYLLVNQYSAARFAFHCL